MRAVLSFTILCCFSVYTVQCCQDINVAKVLDDNEFEILKNCSKADILNSAVESHETTLLHLAARRGNVHLIKYLVEEKGFDVDLVDQHNSTPLQLAVEETQLPAVKLLVDLGADVNIRTPRYILQPCLIFMAVNTFDVDIVKFLLEKGAVPCTSRHWKSTILHRAVELNNKYMVSVLVRYNDMINARNIKGELPIDLTTGINEYTATRYSEVIQILVRAGSFVPDQLIWNFWYFQVDNNVLKLLIEKSGKVNVRVTWDKRDCRESMLMMLLMMENPQYDMIKFVIDQGADVKILYCGNYTALHRVAVLNRVNCTLAVRMLLDHGADINVINIEGLTPLDEADLRGHKELAQYLRNFGGENSQSYLIHQSAKMDGLLKMKSLLESDKNLLNYNESGTTLLQIAAEEGSVNVISYLVEEQGVDVNQKDNKGNSALSKAVEAGKLESVELLLNLGADKNIDWLNLKFKVLEDGLTLLHQAARRDLVNVIKFLLKHYDVDVRSSNGETPAFVAAKEGSFQSLRFLFNHNANFNAINKDGSTLLHAAAHADKIRCAQLLTKFSNQLINRTDYENRLPIDVAISTKMIEKLVEAGSDIPDFCILKHFDMGNIDLVEYLMIKSGKVNLRLKNGKTLLLNLLSQKYPPHDKIITLLHNGADVYIKYYNNITALHAAALNSKHENQSLLKLLLRHGAEVNAQDRFGFTPLDYGDEKVATYLRKECGGHSGINENNSGDISKAKTEAQRYLKIQDKDLSYEVVHLHLDNDVEDRKRFQSQHYVIHQNESSTGLFIKKS